MGDIYAKVGSENGGLEQIIMGVHVMGQWNKNGEMFVDFCFNQDMVIGVTLFPDKRSYLGVSL